MNSALLQLYEISKWELSHGIHPRGHLRTQLQINGPHTQLVHGQIGEEHHLFFLHTYDEPCVSLVAAMDDLHVVTHLEELLQLRCWEFQRILKENKNLVTMVM